MKPAPTAILAPLVASLAGWMLSGSPVPMALSILVLLTALAGGAILGRGSEKNRRLTRSLAPVLIAGLAFALEVRLFSSGQALAVRAELPFPFHIGMALLWWVVADLLVRLSQGRGFKPQREGLAGIVGGIVFLASCAATVLYDFGPWEVYPLAALPVTAHVAGFLLPSFPPGKNLVLVVLPSTLALTALLLGSTYAAERLRPWLYPNEFALSETLSSRTSTPGGNRGMLDGASRHLPRAGDVRFRGEVMVQVKAHSPELFRSWVKSPLYLRTSTLALFESDEVISPVRSGRWIYDTDDGLEDNSIDLDTPLATNASPYTLFISRDSVGHLPVLINSATLFTSAVYEFADDWYQLSPPEEITSLRYTAKAPPLSPRSKGETLDFEALRMQEAPAIYLNLPPSPLASRVTGLTARFDRKNPLQGIRDFLKANTSYTLQFKTPDDSSPVEAFLFGRGQGHCEHYAAATVLMLRSLGVPSRIAYGYAGGAADIGKQILAFRDSDFHAWAEILAPDPPRWVLFDTTPSVPTAAPQAPVSISLPVMDESIYHDFSEFDPDSVATGSGFGEHVAGIIAFLSRHFFLTTVIGIGLLAGVWRILPRRGRFDDPSPVAGIADRVAAPFLPEFLHELELGARALGETRKPGHTWREFLERLGGQAALPGELDAAVAYYYSVCYSARDRDAAMEREFLRQIRQWHGLPQSD